MGLHEVGEEVDRKINTDDHRMTYLEKFSNGMVLHASEKELFSFDEFRTTTKFFADIICFAYDVKAHHVVVCTLCSSYPRALL